MKSHTLIFAEVNKDSFEAIREGTKRIETRASTTKYHKIQPGDTLIMSCAGEKFEKKVKKVTHFKSIADILKTYKPNEINPKTHSEEEITKMWYSFPNYKEKIDRFGLLAFELE